jgi:hypothetical protein
MIVLRTVTCWQRQKSEQLRAALDRRTCHCPKGQAHQDNWHWQSASSFSCRRIGCFWRCNWINEARNATGDGSGCLARGSFRCGCRCVRNGGVAPSRAGAEWRPSVALWRGHGAASARRAVCARTNSAHIAGQNRTVTQQHRNRKRVTIERRWGEATSG